VDERQYIVDATMQPSFTCVPPREPVSTAVSPCASTRLWPGRGPRRHDVLLTLLRAVAMGACCCHFAVAGIPDDCAKDSNEWGEAQWRYFPRLD
jgi:hypothetical protein